VLVAEIPRIITPPVTDCEPPPTLVVVPAKLPELIEELTLIGPAKEAEADTMIAVVAKARLRTIDNTERMVVIPGIDWLLKIR
jgi:hypothetical protein